MIVFDLKCQSNGHVFEAWFSSSDDFEDQSQRGLVACPMCGSEAIEKAVMAPRVSAKANQAMPVLGGADPASVKAMLASLAQAQKRLLADSDYVGEGFADEARAIHLGEAAVRSIYGKATSQETERLLEEGIPVAHLPLPVVLPGEEN
jgi:hypothetical protein